MRLHRRGRGQIKTAQQLAVELAVPVYYILTGKAQAAFPETSTPAPSSFVMVILTSPGVDQDHLAAFPAYVNWRQWRDVVAPILEAAQDDQNSTLWPGFLGYLGGTSGLGAITEAPLGPGLYACNRGLRADYLILLTHEIENRAIGAGYPSTA